MYIPENAIEVAAPVMYETEWPDLKWADAEPWLKSHWNSVARAGMEAAAPFIAAQALRDAAEQIRGTVTTARSVGSANGKAQSASLCESLAGEVASEAIF